MFNWSSFYWWKSFHLTNRLHVLYTTNIIVPLKVNRSSTGCIRRVAFFSFIDDNRIFFSFNSRTYTWVSFSLNVFECMSASIKTREILIRWPVARASAWVRACMCVWSCVYACVYVCAKIFLPFASILSLRKA